MVNNNSGIATKYLSLIFFSILYVFLVKILNIFLGDKNKNMHIYKKKIPKLNYIHLKLFLVA